MKTLLILFAVAGMAVVPLDSLAGEALTEKDRAELSALYDAFHKDTRIGKQSNYPKYIESESLANLAEARRNWFVGMLRHFSKEQLSDVYEFNPDLDSVLEMKSPEEFFEAIQPARNVEALAKAANVINVVVAVAGDRSKAFIIVEGYHDGDMGKTDPFYSVWPAIVQEGHWRLDVSSNILRDLMIKVRNIDKQFSKQAR